jgi:hypothetical protein
MERLLDQPLQTTTRGLMQQSPQGLLPLPFQGLIEGAAIRESGESIRERQGVQLLFE